MNIRFSSALPLVTLFCMTGTAVFAAPPAAAPQKMGAKMGGMKKMAATLNLTDAQKTKIKAIMDASKPQRKAIHDNTTLTPEQKKAKMKVIRAASDKKVMAVLTPAQRTKFAAMIKRRHEKMMAMHAGQKPK